MIEIIDNALQLGVSTVCMVWAGILAFQRKSQNYSILACFYGTFALGLFYWLVFLMLRGYTPKIFYVSDLSWAASFLFLFLLSCSLGEGNAKGKQSFAAWAVGAVLVGLTVWICSFGDYINTIAWCSPLIASGYLCTKSLLYARKQSGEERRRQVVYFAILFLIFVEFCLWITSCYFKGDSLANPYFFCDFGLSLGLLGLMFSMRKAVDA